VTRMNCTDVELNWKGMSISATAVWCVENDGIGDYEYWGAKGHDRGHNYVYVEELIGVMIQHQVTDKYVPVDIKWLRKYEEDLIEQATEQISEHEGHDDGDY
jgi:hypothetical protein